MGRAIPCSCSQKYDDTSIPAIHAGGSSPALYDDGLVLQLYLVAQTAAVYVANGPVDESFWSKHGGIAIAECFVRYGCTVAGFPDCSNMDTTNPRRFYCSLFLHLIFSGARTYQWPVDAGPQ